MPVHVPCPRSVSIVLVLASGIAFCAACSFFAKPKRTIRLVVYSPHGKEILSDIERRFESLHETDKVPIDVIADQVPSQILVERLMSEQIRPRCDVWWGGSSTLFMKAREQQLLEPYRTAEVASHLRREHRDPDYFWLGASLSPYVIIYSRRKVSSEEAPNEWDDLLDPRWKGRIIIRDPLSSESMRAFFCAMIYRFFKRSASPGEGYEWLTRLHANTQTYAPTSETLFADLDAGESGTVSICTLQELMLQQVRYGYDFEHTIPASGAPIAVEGIAILRDAPSPEIAKKFVDFLTSRENQLYLADRKNEYFRVPTRTDLRGQLPDWARWTDTGSDEFDQITMAIDWDIVRQHEAEWVEYWREHIRTAR